MGHYGGRTPKRHRGYTNNAWCSQVDLGVYSRALRGKKTVETVRRYLNKSGKKAYVGTKELKSTQSLPYLAIYICMQRYI